MTFLKKKGYFVRGADWVLPEYEPSHADEFLQLDLRRWEHCLIAAQGMDQIYNLAANMGGIGFIETHKAEIVHDNTLINVHMIEAARQCQVSRYLYTSSACIYPGYRQNTPDVSPLKELKQLVSLHLKDNPDLTKAQIAELQKALPNCKISHNATK